VVTPTAAFDLADDILAAIEATFTAEGIDLPSLRYVHHGAVALDCPLLVVGLERLALGQAAAENAAALKCPVPRVATYAAWLTRCVPTPDANGKTPDADDLLGSARELLTDAWLLVTGVPTAYLAGDFSTRCQTFAVTGLDPYGPQGGHGGSVLRMRAEL
jgi:hypothetical protein